MREPTRDEIVRKAKKTQEDNVEAFAEWLDARTEDPARFASITEMERMLGDAQKKAAQGCRDFLGDWLDNVDESMLNDQKKRVPGKGGDAGDASQGAEDHSHDRRRGGIQPRPDAAR